MKRGGGDTEVPFPYDAVFDVDKTILPHLCFNNLINIIDRIQKDPTTTDEIYQILKEVILILIKTLKSLNLI